MRAGSGGIQNVSCLVDGCESDLSNCREYHRRHKVCEAHSKTPIVLVGGMEQRFCQQCSRFHLLGEFDEVKRSCRKRLDGHNRRRRKPQPQMVNPRNFFAAQQGHGFIPFQNLYPRVTPTPSWTSVMKYRDNCPNKNNQAVPFISRQEHSIQFCKDYKQGKHFPFLQDYPRTVTVSQNCATALDVSVPQQHVNTFSSSESSGSGQMFSEGLVQALDSECAPSLLSSPTQASSFNVAPLVAAASSDQIPLGQPLVGNLQQQQQHFALNKYSCLQTPTTVSSTGFYRLGIMEDHAGTVLVPDVNAADFGYHGFFGTEHGSPNDQSPVGPFTWQ